MPVLDGSGTTVGMKINKVLNNDSTVLEQLGLFLSEGTIIPGCCVW